MDSSNPHRWRGEWLHCGDVVCHVVCAFCAAVCAFCVVLSGRHLLLYVDKYERITLGRVIDDVTKCPTQACTIPAMQLGTLLCLSKQEQGQTRFDPNWITL